MRRFLTSVSIAVVAYIAGAFGGGLLISLLSSNNHDRSLEAAMTGAFVTGPLAGFIGLGFGIWWSGKRGGDSGEG